MDQRICPSCSIEQPIGNFYRNDNASGGRTQRCRSCIADRPREWIPSETYRQRKKSNDQASRARRRVADPQFIRKKRLRDKYGISYTDYLELLEKQGHQCAICRVTFDETGTEGPKPCVDHCHDSERVRGILCHFCNIAIGFFRDNPALMANAIKYLTEQ